MAQSFGEVLRKVRQAKGMNQRQLAARVGVDDSYISKLENGRLPPPAAATILRICEAVGAPPDELLALTGKVPPEFIGGISTSTAALEFVRNAQSMALSEEEWKELTHRLKRLRS